MDHGIQIKPTDQVTGADQIRKKIVYFIMSICGLIPGLDLFFFFLTFKLVS